jgi:hypothetical protein
MSSFFFLNNGVRTNAFIQVLQRGQLQTGGISGVMRYSLSGHFFFLLLLGIEPKFMLGKHLTT